MGHDLSRRNFLIGTAVVAGSGFGLGLWRRHRRGSRDFKTFKAPDVRKSDGLVGPGKVVVAKGPDPGENVRRALEKAGAIQKLVSPGDVVVVKPNMAWGLPPALGANANPQTVAAVVELCRAAGAKVVVFDRTMSRDPSGPYRTSGVAEAARQAGGTVHYVDETRFHEMAIPDAFALDAWTFYEMVLFADKADVLINIPAAKTHSTSELTLGMKNAFGMVGGERGRLHQQIHEKIADLNRVVKVDLTILDATRVMWRNGPNSPRKSDVYDSPERAQRIIVGTDPVAVDACGATLFGRAPEDIGFIRRGEEAGLGEMKFTITEA